MIFNSMDFELFIRRFSISKTLLMNSYDLQTAVASAPLNPFGITTYLYIFDIRETLVTASDSQVFYYCTPLVPFRICSCKFTEL